MSVDGIGIRLGQALGPARPVGQRPEADPARGAAEPDLTSVLSAEERAYFAELERLGPVTYGPKNSVRTDAPPPVLGQRIDVRA